MKFSSLNSFFLGACITFIVVFTFIFIGVWFQDSRMQSKIYPSVFLDGKSMEGTTLAEAQKPYIDATTKLQSELFEVHYEGVPVATISGEMIGLQTNGKNISEQAFLITRTGDRFNRLKQKLQILLGTKRFSFTSSLEYSMDPFMEVLNTLDKQYSYEPQNALFEMKNGKVSAFTTEKNGRQVNVDAAVKNIRKQLMHDHITQLLADTKPVRVIVTSSVIKPEVTLAESNTLGISEIIGVGTSDYSGSIPERVHNLILATQRIHGTIIPKGATFSYNKTIGEISGRTGYKPAYVIVNGRTELGDGGGVCQTSTTVFRAALYSGLPITDWHAHAYRVHYYENDSKPGMDATVYSPSVDFQFTNDTSSAILIDAQVTPEKNLLTYTFWGKKDDRTIAISDITMGPSIGAPPPREQEDPTLKRGVRRQVDWAANGLTTWFDYKVSKGEKIIQEKRFTSYYRPWQAVYLVGTQD